MEIDHHSLYLIGGQQHYLLPVNAKEQSLYEYHKAVIVQLHPSSDTSAIILDYISPEHARAETGSMLFKAASVHGDKLFLCSTTEILIYSLPGMIQTGYITSPLFNDVHHVTQISPGRLLVANSGLDMVIEITEDGEVLNCWDVQGKDPWHRFKRDVDYRKMNTKPHQSHPNFVFFLDGEPWVTRFYQRDAVSLRNQDRRITIGVGNPHDGIVKGDYVYFTVTNGQVVIVHRKTFKIEEIIDLNKIHNHGGPLAWSRGLMVEDDKIWVGYSRLRPTKWKENVDWMKHSLKWQLRWMLPGRYVRKSKWMKKGLKKELPTRVACYDLKTRECLKQVEVEKHGISAIFSIFSDSMMLKAGVYQNLITKKGSYGLPANP